MVQAPGDLGQVLQSAGDVVRTLFKDLTAFVLRQVPPLRGFLDRDQRRARGVGPAESLLAQSEGIMFGASDVPLVARDPAQDPRGISYGPARGLAFQELDMPGRRQ